MRKLATIRKIAEIRPIEGADAIEHYRVDGWWVVGKKGQFKIGDLVTYLEIDSWCPTALAPFLSKGKAPREFNGVKGERLKTVKLRGAISQGLLLPTEAITDTVIVDGYQYRFCDVMWAEGEDVTEVLGVQKYEPPLPAQLRGKIAGMFPGWLKKTDQERIQNLFRAVESMLGDAWQVEEKLDGSSMTVGYRAGDFLVDKEGQPIPEEFAVCSRNLSLKLDDDENSFVKTAKATGVLNAMKAYGRNLGISGELIGEGIQGNLYAIHGQQWFVFDILDVDTGKYVSAGERAAIVDDLRKLGADLRMVPDFRTRRLTGETVATLLKMAEGKSELNPKAEREGLVFKNLARPDISFKAISDLFLLKGGN